MAESFEAVSKKLQNNPRRWLVTGVAGFIGSHLLERLLLLDQVVVGVDNFSTGFETNLNKVRDIVGSNKWANFQFYQGSVEDLTICNKALQNIEFVLHQAALGSVPRSVENPLASHQANVNGFVNLIETARLAKVRRFVYASSSSVYGDSPDLPKREDRVGTPISPYAATKAIDEIYAATWFSCYKFETVGLRYFNVFGPRQDPKGAYAAVVPRWLDNILHNQSCVINGDGKTSRDFCYVENVVQANILAAYADNTACGKSYNIACGTTTSLRDLHDTLWCNARELGLVKTVKEPVMAEFRAGDIKHSLADISRAKASIGFTPVVSFSDGVRRLLQSVSH